MNEKTSEQAETADDAQVALDRALQGERLGALGNTSPEDTALDPIDEKDSGGDGGRD